jgi:hypothetical protein
MKLQITNSKLQTKKRKERKVERSESQPGEIINSKNTQINRSNWAVGNLLFRILVIVIWNLFVIWDL